MKVRYVTASGRMTFEFEAADDKAVVKRLATIQDCFEESECGCCKSKHIQLKVRVNGEYTFYTWTCLACNAQLDLPTAREGNGMWAKRWDKDNKKPFPNRGWFVYGKDERATGTASSSSSTPAKSAEDDFDNHF